MTMLDSYGNTCVSDEAAHAQLIEMRDSLEALRSDIARLLHRPPIDETVTIWPSDAGASSGSPYTVHDYDRAHLMIFCMASSMVTIDVPGLGLLNLTLGAGWNVCDFPPNTMVKMQTGQSKTNVMIRACDDVAPNLV